MEERPPNAETQQALEELQRYLTDQMAPLMVADSFGHLLEQSPRIVALQIHAWMATQFRKQAGAVSVSSYLFHALKKIHALGEFKLVPHAPLARYLEQLSQILIEEVCPAEERDLLRESVGLLGQAETALAPTVEILHRPGGPAVSVSGAAATGAAGPHAASADAAAQGLRRLSLLLDRLGALPDLAAGSAPALTGQRGDLISEILTTAAVNAQTSSELERYLSPLRHMGVEPRIAEIFRILARGVPGWGIFSAPSDAPAAAAATPGRADGPIEAMRRLISMSSDVEEGAERFGAMVRAAIEQFNDGAIGVAVSMLDLAHRILEEKKVVPAAVKGLLAKAHESLDAGKLGELAAKPDKHAFLLKILDFFPALRPRGLLDALDGEPRRERRHLLLSLLEVHGDAARALAYEDLRASLHARKGQVSPYHQRNLVYLLRRLPRHPGEPWEEEMEDVIRLTSSDVPSIVRKEAIAALGQVRHERAERTLIERVRELARSLTNARSEDTDERRDRALLLDRALYSLARFGTQNAWRTVVEHGLKPQPQLGDTAASLSYLSGQDLSADKETIVRLLKALKEELPLKVLGFSLQRGTERAAHFIKALSGTPSPSVHHALDDVSRRFAGTEIAQHAAKALAGLGATQRVTETAVPILTGDLEMFGLPNLLQSLSDSGVTGVLTLSDTDGEVVGSIEFEAGRLRDCHAGALRGDTAIYQLFEKPSAGTFVLRTRGDGSWETDAGEPPRDVLPVVLEAVRRHDEFRKARALVPDDVSLRPTGTKPTRAEGEEDDQFLRNLWGRIASGLTPSQCEEAIPADSYRIRSLLAHWVEEGALQPS